ncbi:MAG: L-2-amino-thiazoline-4-carboxylic acid hydrolase [Spirochaetes bacterium]|nr:L-2-amino-thiazoline-4-carboxylic acid hydrolase [Spirochaetota bacterium]
MNSAENSDAKLKDVHFFHMKDKADLLKALIGKFGNEVLRVIESTECIKAKHEWQAVAGKTESNSIEDLIRLLWEPLKEKGFKFSMQKCDNGYQFTCTACPIYEMAKLLNAEDIFFHHTCSTDFSIAEGFNPAIKLKRTKTLMEGHDCCNHFYFI